MSALDLAALGPAVPKLAACAWLATTLAIVVGLALRSALRGRPVLVASLALAALPSLAVAFAWAGWLEGERVRFERPGLTLVAFAAVAWAALRLAGAPTRQHRARRALGDLFVPLAVLAPALAAAGPELGQPLDRMSVVVAVDRSRSIDLVPGADERVRRELQVAERGMREHDRVGVVAFGATAALEDPLRPASDLPSPQHVELGRDATDVAAAVRRALLEAPTDAASRIVVVSDGNSTRGDAFEAAARAVARGIAVDVVPLEPRQVADVRAVALRVAAHADQGESLDVRVVTSATQDSEVEVRLLRDGELVRSGKTRIQKGEDLVRLREIAPSQGLHRYDVEVAATDPALDAVAADDTATAFVRVRGRASALVIAGDAVDGDLVATALADAAFGVTRGGPSAAPADAAELAAWDLVVVAGVAASDLAPAQIDALAAYARDLGGGLLLVGGPKGMGPGGWSKTPIEEVSPVSFDVKQERRRTSLSEVVAIDYSGSMAASAGAGKTKLDLANEAAARSAALLGKTDRVAVEHVDTAATWTVPMRAADDTDAIAAKIRGVACGGGGIYTDLALREAYAALAGETSNLRHTLLFADGDDAEQLKGCRALAAGALARGITTSVVALGRGHDVAELEVLSRVGGGRFYLVEDATRLPAVFAQETVLAARSAIHEVTFRPTLASPSAATRGIDPAEGPPLEGYVVTIPKARASTSLAGPEGDPVLATWSVGLGRVGAFTSDLGDRWGAAFRGWPGASRLVAQLGRDLARKADDPRVRLSAEIRGGELLVRADVVGDDGRAQTFRRLVAHVGGPGGLVGDVPLEPVAAGAYVAKLAVDRPGSYVVVAKDELDATAVGTAGAALGSGEELTPSTAGRARLATLAALTGGTVRDTLAGIFAARPPRRWSRAPLGPALALASALLMLGAVAARRLALPERTPRRAEARPEPARPAFTTRTLDALRGAKRHAPAAAPPVDAAPPIAPFAAEPATRPSTVPRFATPSRPPQEPAAAPPPRTRTAAEILLEKRRAAKRGP